MAVGFLQNGRDKCCIKQLYFGSLGILCTLYKACTAEFTKQKAVASFEASLGLSRDTICFWQCFFSDISGALSQSSLTPRNFPVMR